MTRSDEGSEPGVDLPQDILDELERSDDRQLREIIHYAQDLLHQRQDPTTELEPRQGEEILRTDDHGTYTIVIAKRTDVTGSEQGPYAYRVRYEPGIDDEDGQFKWHYLGRVDE